MEEKKDNFSLEQLKMLAQSEAGKQLMALLQANGTAGTVRQKAQSRNMAQAQEALQNILSDPKAQALLKQLEAQDHG